MDDELSSLYARLYLDQDVPVQLAGMLQAHGFDVLTTLDAGALGQPDDLQLQTAIRERRALVTHNRLDFELLHKQYLNEEQAHFGIIIAVQRRDLTLTRDHLLQLLNRLDGEQLCNQLFYV